jgi:hypothetical protein
MTRAADAHEEMRKNALTAFLEMRLAEGYRIETRTDTHAIIAPAAASRSLFDRLHKPRASARQVISVDEHGKVTMAPAEPLRS